MKSREIQAVSVKFSNLQRVSEDLSRKRRRCFFYVPGVEICITVDVCGFRGWVLKGFRGTGRHVQAGAGLKPPNYEQSDRLRIAHRKPHNRSMFGICPFFYLRSPC